MAPYSDWTQAMRLFTDSVSLSCRRRSNSGVTTLGPKTQNPKDWSRDRSFPELYAHMKKFPAPRKISKIFGPRRVEIRDESRMLHRVIAQPTLWEPLGVLQRSGVVRPR